MIENKNNNLTLIDLFCGAGIGACGFKIAGCEIVYAVDNKNYAVDTYNENIGKHAVLKDIRTLNSHEIPDADVIAGGFPCFTDDVLISIKGNKLKKISDIKIGEYVLTHKNRYRKVKSIMKKHTNVIYEIISEKNRICMNVTKEHPFYIADKNTKEYSWKAIKDIDSEFIVMSNNTNHKNYYNFSRKECFVLGSLVAFINKFEINTFAEIEEALNEGILKGLDIKQNRNKTIKLVKKLKHLYSKTDEFQTIPGVIIDLPKKLLKIFINSFLKEFKSSTDNTIVLFKNKVIALQVLQIINKVFPGKSYIKQNKNNFILKISKYNEYENDKQYTLTKLKIKKEKQKSCFVYNLEVEDDNSYVADNYIVHNCQPFSIAGKGEGISDKKQGDLGYHFYRIINEKKPKAFLMENVSGILNKRHKDFFDNLIKLFDEAGYNVTWNLVNCWEYGVPQLRKRVFAVGIRKDLKKIFKFPTPIPIEKRTTIRDAIGDLPEPNGIKNHKGYGIRKDEAEFVDKIPIGGNWRNLNEEEQKKFLGKAFYSGGGRTGFLRKIKFENPAFTITSCMQGKNNAQIIDNTDKYFIKNQDAYYEGDFSSRYMSRNRQKQWNEPSFTIVSSARQLPLYPDPPNYDIRELNRYNCPPPRRFTVRECLRLQTVPDWFVFNDEISLQKQYERCSGIPSLIAYLFINEISKCINENYENK